MPKRLPTDFYLVRIVESYLNIIVVRKGQGACSENRRKPWLKQLRVAVSTEASLPVGSSPQNPKQILSTCAMEVEVFKKLTKNSPRDMLEIRE
jgi:hypothetical protein